MPQVQYGALDALQAYVTQQTGLVPANDRHAIVDAQGNVLGAINADLACGDGYPGMTLVPDASAGPGWTYLNGVFTAPPSNMTPQLLAAKVAAIAAKSVGV